MIDMTKYKELSMECDAAEIERIFAHKSISFANYDLISEVFNRAMRRYSSFNEARVPISLSSVYLMGYIHGIRAERKRRKLKS